MKNKKATNFWLLASLILTVAVVAMVIWGYSAGKMDRLHNSVAGLFDNIGYLFGWTEEEAVEIISVNEGAIILGEEVPLSFEIDTGVCYSEGLTENVPTAGSWGIRRDNNKVVLVYFASSDRVWHNLDPFPLSASEKEAIELKKALLGAVDGGVSKVAYVGKEYKLFEEPTSEIVSGEDLGTVGYVSIQKGTEIYDYAVRLYEGVDESAMEVIFLPEEYKASVFETLYKRKKGEVKWGLHEGDGKTELQRQAILRAYIELNLKADLEIACKGYI